MQFACGIEVAVTRPNNGAAYANLKHGQDQYVVGVAGQPFDIRLSAPKSQFISSAMSIRVHVDGLPVGHHPHLKASRRSKILRGFVTTVQGQHFVRQFVFGQGSAQPGDSQAGDGLTSSRTGTIEIEVTAVEKTSKTKTPCSNVQGVNTELGQAVEGKKWFMQPSLSAQQGEVVGKPIRFSSKVYKTVRSLMKCTIRMETAPILVLRKLLNPDIPAHQAIINQSEAPAQNSTHDDEIHTHVGAAKKTKRHTVMKTDIKQELDATVTDLTTTALEPRHGRKRRPASTGTGPSTRVKTEPLDLRSNSAAAHSECIDLT